MIVIFIAVAFGLTLNAWLRAGERAAAAEAELRRLRRGAR